MFKKKWLRERMCPHGLIMVEKNVGLGRLWNLGTKHSLKKRWARKRCVPSEKTRSRRRCGPRVKMGIGIVSWGGDGVGRGCGWEPCGLGEKMG
jgi:hypothetical protein